MMASPAALAFQRARLSLALRQYPHVAGAIVAWPKKLCENGLPPLRFSILEADPLPEPI
jgi:hypothetical protein